MSEKYNFQVKTTPKGVYEIGIDPVKGYGYVEKNGVDFAGLWFESGELVDFDGCYFIPRSVGKVIESFGYKLDEDCYIESTL